MNVSVEAIMTLAHALGASGDMKAEGIARLAAERLSGPREYFLEVLEGEQWTFHGWHATAGEAQAARSRLRQNFDRQYRIVELLRRVLS